MGFSVVFFDRVFNPYIIHFYALAKKASTVREINHMISTLWNDSNRCRDWGSQLEYLYWKVGTICLAVAVNRIARGQPRVRLFALGHDEWDTGMHAVVKIGIYIMPEPKSKGDAQTQTIPVIVPRAESGVRPMT